MRRRSFIITLAMVAGLALGVVAGPALRGAVVSAQTQPQAQKAGPLAGLRDTFLNKLAAALGIGRPALDSAVKDAASQTADEAVKQGQLSQAQADQLKQRIQQGQFDGFWGGHEGRHGGTALGGVRQAMFDAAAKQLKITPQELMTQLRSGQTLAQLAAAHGTTEQAVVSAATAAAKTQFDAAVKAGQMTQAQADAFYARLQQAGTQIFGHEGRETGERGRGRHGWNGQQQSAPQAPAAPQAPTGTSGL